MYIVLYTSPQDERYIHFFKTFVASGRNSKKYINTWPVSNLKYTSACPSVRLPNHGRCKRSPLSENENIA